MDRYYDDFHCYCEDCGREISREEYQENMGFCDICFDYHEENGLFGFDTDNEYLDNYYNEENFGAFSFQEVNYGK